MNIENIIQEHIVEKDGLSQSLGIIFLSTPEEDTCVAKMKVDERNRQPYGYLSGGASLAMAETVAGVGSLALCPGRKALGINVQAQHVKPALEGDIVTATAVIRHKGRTLHVWQVEIRNSAGDLVSNVSVTNYMI